MRPAEIPPATLAVLVFVACLSISLNWYRRVLNAETPRRLLWWRLDSPVWRLLGVVILMAAFVAALGAAGFAVMTQLPPLLTPRLGCAAQGLAIAVYAILGLIGRLAGCRLASKLPAAASGARGYAALRTTKHNSWRFLAMIFWLVFTLAFAGAIAAGGYFLLPRFDNAWTTGLALVLAAAAAWFALFFLLTVPASLYRYFGEGKDFDPG